MLKILGVVMIVLAPLLSGKEAKKEFVNAITEKVDTVILLHIVDKEFMKRTTSAMGEVRQFSSLLAEVKKAVGAKRKTCDEVTEWGQTIPKLLSVAQLKRVDKVVLVKQRNTFFNEILNELEKNKIAVELVDVPDDIPIPQKKKGFF